MTVESSLKDKVPLEGFLLTGEGEDVADRFYLRFFGKGRHCNFEVVLTDQFPFFYMEASGVPNLPFPFRLESQSLCSFSNEPVTKIIFRTWKDTRRARDLMRQQGISIFESDLKPAEKYLMEHQIYGRVILTSPRYVRQRPGLEQWIDPTIEPWNPLPGEEVTDGFSLLSIDIETGKQGQLFSIAMHYCPSKECSNLGLENNTYHNHNAVVDNNSSELTNASCESQKVLIL
ncbi:MAG: hypothetical protein CMP10_20175, partial [Zetaproteobacteria bacterium]|nr:hypothetical protein [Pseudobdellovibrionaceae bacterium]